MGYVLEYDARNDVLRVTLEGRVTDAIVLDSYAQAARYVANRPCQGLFDLTPVTNFEVSRATIEKIAAEAPIIASSSGTAVIVAPQDHVYGMMRMFQILGEKTRPNLHVVRTMNEASRILLLDSPEFVLVA